MGDRIRTSEETTTGLVLRTMVPADWTYVADIYRQGIETGNATFQETIPSWEEWDAGKINACRIVAAMDGTIAGWAALSPVSGRCVYAGVAEVSVYVSNAQRGRKIGTRLLERLIAESEQEGFWMLQAGIFPENTPSLKIHEALGFRRVGRREKIGKQNGRWRDILLLERRSRSVGVE